MRQLRVLIMPALAVLATAAQALDFTGNVPADFATSGVIAQADSVREVLMPVQAPTGQISGWDLQQVFFRLDGTADRLEIGLDFAALAGDADGDGIEGVSPLWLATSGGLDAPKLGSGGSICVAFDFDRNGRWDAVVGFPLGVDTYQVATFNGEGTRPYQAFGEALPAHLGIAHFTGTAEAPDVEFSLAQAASLLVFQGTIACFDYRVFAGSFDDGPIGEDTLQGTACVTAQ